MTKHKITVSEHDRTRLERLIERIRENGSDADRHNADQLESELRRANVLGPEEMPKDVITMNSIVRMCDLESKKEYVYSLSFPADSEPTEGRISILAPVGTAMLGYRIGDVIDWPVPKGTRRLEVLEIIYQPESAGHMHL